MKKSIITVMISALAAMSIAGCGNAIPEMNEQQQELIVEYAVGEVLKHDQNHEYKLTELALELETATETADSTLESTDEELTPDASSEESASISETPQGTATVEDTEGAVAQAIIDNTGSGESTFSSIEAVLNLPNVKFTYTGYETESFYPNQADELYFVMNATDGNTLLILKFNVENTSSESVNLDMAATNARFRVYINGEEKNALTTMLLDDLAYYQGTLEAGENKELVLVCEIPEQQEANISSLGISVRNVENTATISLF